MQDLLSKGREFDSRSGLSNGHQWDWWVSVDG